MMKWERNTTTSGYSRNKGTNSCISNQVVIPLLVPQVIEPVNNLDEQYEGKINDPITHNEIVINELGVDEPQPIA